MGGVGWRCVGEVGGVCRACAGRVLGHVRGVCGVVRGACVGRAWDVRGGGGAISVGITRSALLSGYLGKSGHLPRYL